MRRPAAAAARGARPAVVFAPVPGLERVLGKPAGAATALLGPPGLDRHDGPGRHLQFVGTDCILDLYYYPDPAAGQPTARYADARHRDGKVLPHGDIDGPLPVLLDPYGGPHAQRVVSAQSAYLSSQWFADQGFAVDRSSTVAARRAVVPEWEREVLPRPRHRRCSTTRFEALAAVATELAAAGIPLDLAIESAIRGWSFGGYLAALAVMTPAGRLPRRRSPGHPSRNGACTTRTTPSATSATRSIERRAVRRLSSLLPLAGDLTRPLLLIHGLADDNVVAAHTLQMSSALLAAGKPHEVLPLSGVTHMTPQEIVAENLLLHQLEFLRRALRIETPS